MKRQSCGTNGIPKIGSFPYRPAKKLGRDYKVYGSSTRNNENIHLNQPSKKLDQKRYKPFGISKNIGLGVF